MGKQDLISVAETTKHLASPGCFDDRRSVLPVRSPSDMEAKFYYYGLPSLPRLVDRSSTTPWVVATGPWARPTPKELRPIGDHKGLKKAWQTNLPTQLFQVFDKLNVNWTCLDVVRIANARDDYPAGDDDAPAIVWIGVMPGSLPSQQGYGLAMQVKSLLQSHGITDVECEIRETQVLRSVGPKLLKAATHYKDPMRDVRIPITTTLGQPISTFAKPWEEGTLGFFIQRGEDRSTLFCVTAGHVVATQKEEGNVLYRRTTTSQPAQKVILLGTWSYGQLLAKIREQVDGQTIVIELLKEDIKTSGENKSNEAKAQRITDQRELDGSRKAREAFRKFEKEVETNWDNPENRVLGFKLLSPPPGGRGRATRIYPGLGHHQAGPGKV